MSLFLAAGWKDTRLISILPTNAITSFVFKTGQFSQSAN